MARIVNELGRGGLTYCEQELGWDPKTMRKGQAEVDSGIDCLDAFGNRGRHRVEERLPTLLEDIKEILDGQSQTDPTFRTQRLYTRALFCLDNGGHYSQVLFDCLVSDNMSYPTLFFHIDH